MLKRDVIDYFGNSSNVARVLGLTPGAVHQWKEEIPVRRAFEIERLTKGKLKVSYRPKEQAK